MNDDEMDCDELVEIVTDYLDGELDASTRAQFEEHLLDCDGCVNYLQQFRATVDTLGRITSGQLEPTFRDRLLSALTGWHR